jgi:gamma-glutamylcyclotransferase
MPPSPRATHTLFFAYGTNMAPEVIRARCPQAEVVSVARLPHHAVEFHGFSKVWDGALETVVPSPGHDVWGVVYRLTVGDSNRLDSWQDVRLDGTGAYFHFPTEVIDDDGVVHPVLLYKKDTQNDLALPSAPYLRHLVAGAVARRLPGAYIRTLSSHPTKEPRYEVPKRGTFDRSLVVDLACSGCG